VIAEMAELSENLGELVLNDVLIVNRYIISSSEQVVGTTDQNHRNYKDSKVWVFFWIITISTVLGVWQKLDSTLTLRVIVWSLSTGWQN
jgi:hypothetical protein